MRGNSVRSFGAASAVLLAAAIFLGSNPSPRPAAEKHRGMSWVASRRPITLEDLRPLADHHIDWIVQTPFGWQSGFDSPQVRLATGGRIHWGESDEGLRTTAALARQLGIRTLLKPHIWMRRSTDGKWRSNIEMSSAADWESWFESYRRFILHYARLAQESGIEALCVGTELHRPAVLQPGQWRRLIREVRQVYGGKLTYAANWYREFEEVEFWDQLDFIGIQAYFPLTRKDNPSVEDLKAGWQPHLKAIERISRHFGKPVLFTEIGYRSAPDAAVEPWKWPQHSAAAPIDFETQLNAYEAFFQTFWDRPWFAGAFFWKWYARIGRMPNENDDFTPQSKPAAQVLSRWYGR